MRPLVILIFALSTLTGCTATKLGNSIVDQTATLTNLQYQQVLGNLARLHSDPWALPSQVILHDGSAQIQDNRAVNATLFLDAHNNLPPSLTGSRTVVEQWGVRPVTDDTELRLLRLAYQRALGISVSLLSEGNFVNDLAHELKKQIPWPETPYYIPRDGEKQREGRFTEDLPLPGVAPLPFHANPDEQKAHDEQILSEITSAIHDRKIVSTYFNRMVINTLSDYIILPSEQFRGLSDLKPEETQSGDIIVSASAREVRRQVKDIEDDLQKIGPGWVHFGSRPPKTACYVGSYNGLYAWVNPDGRRQLADFTLTVLNFCDLIKENAILTSPGGPRFTPTPGR